MKCVDCFHCKVCALRSGSVYADIECSDFIDKQCIAVLDAPLDTIVYQVVEKERCVKPSNEECPAYWDCVDCQWNDYDYHIKEVIKYHLVKSAGKVWRTREAAEKELERCRELNRILKLEKEETKDEN